KSDQRTFPVREREEEEEEKLRRETERRVIDRRKMAMEVATPAPAPIPSERNIVLAPATTTTTATVETHKKNRIQVSNTKKPLFFYVNLAKRYIQQHNEVELSALGMAITTVVTISEILKNNGLATEKKVLTSTVGMKDETKGRMVQKAKAMLGKSDKFDSLVPPVTNGKTPEEEASAETEASVEAQEEVAAATEV
ncbi:unnamed protein product, partial [Arabidopsis halleri]